MLVSRGAKHLIILSRSAATRTSSQFLLKELREAGCSVTARNCDISNEDDLALVKRDCLTTMPPVRGVIHAAMFLLVRTSAADSDVMVQLNHTYVQIRILFSRGCHLSSGKAPPVPRSLDP